jgi:hypothetical protein
MPHIFLRSVEHRSSWSKTDIFYTHILDALRYLVAWQPIIVIVIRGIDMALGLK